MVIEGQFLLKNMDRAACFLLQAKSLHTLGVLQFLTFYGSIDLSIAVRDAMKLCFMLAMRPDDWSRLFFTVTIHIIRRGA